MFNTVEQAIEWITAQRNPSRGIEAFRSLMTRLGNIQDKIPSIHVAGTNGKGSTCTFLRDCLNEAGYIVGTFTSPHMVKHQDRIRINGKWIDDDSFLRICNEYYSIFIENELNMFEIDFIIACEFFIAQSVDFMVIEVGLGGRLDCTNCLHHPLISCITSIGLDHMELLGDTKEKIAYEKAGIIKTDSICVVGQVSDSVFNVILKQANEMHSKIIRCEEVIKIDEESFLFNKKRYEIQSKANYQMQNATVALTILNELSRMNKIKITNDQLFNGIKRSNWEGRFEIVKKHPILLLDGAHNEEGIDALLSSINNLPKPWVFVFSALKDKPALKMVEKIYNVADELIVTEFDFYRVEHAINLKQYDDILCIENAKEAINQGICDAEESGTCIVCGSLYFISEIRDYCLEKGRNDE